MLDMCFVLSKLLSSNSETRGKKVEVEEEEEEEEERDSVCKYSTDAELFLWWIK